MKTTLLIAQISDTHIKPEGRLAYERIDTAWHLGRCVEHLLALDPRPDVVLATGDLVDAGLAEEYRLLARLLAPLPMPVYLIPGQSTRVGRAPSSRRRRAPPIRWPSTSTRERSWGG